MLLLAAIGLVAMSSLASANANETKQRDEAQYFTVVTPGVVKDTRTGLEWMRCSLGQDWDENGKTCKGGIIQYPQEEALNIADKLNAVGGYAQRTDWRMPTIRELQSLRYCSNGFDSGKWDLTDGKGYVSPNCAKGSTMPVIAQAVFPNMESKHIWYWSSSMAGSRPWSVDFNDGALYSGNRGGRLSVRLVRNIAPHVGIQSGSHKQANEQRPQNLAKYCREFRVGYVGKLNGKASYLATKTPFVIRYEDMSVAEVTVEWLEDGYGFKKGGMRKFDCNELRDNVE